MAIAILGENCPVCGAPVYIGARDDCSGFGEHGTFLQYPDGKIRTVCDECALEEIESKGAVEVNSSVEKGVG